MLYAAMQSTISRSRQFEANTHVVLACTETDGTEWHYSYARVVALLPGSYIAVISVMKSMQEITPAKRKRLLRTFGPCPAGYTHDDLERLLDLLYGLFSHVYTTVELRQI